MIDSYDYTPINKKTTTVTFRVDANTISTLRTVSEEKQISLNTLVNQILDRYTEWERFGEKVGMISLPKPIVAKLFDKMTKEEVLDLANSVGKSAVKDIAIFMGNEIDINSFLRWFEIRMKVSSAQLTRTTKDEINTYVVKHDLGMNWSLYHKTILELIFRDFFGRFINVAISDTILKFTINGNVG